MNSKNIKYKVITAIENNKLRLKNGDRNWYQYYISVRELTWARNNHDGFVIDVYSDEYKSSHLVTVLV